MVPREWTVFTGSRGYRQQVRHQLWRRPEDIAVWSDWRALRYSRLYAAKREIQSSRFCRNTNSANPKSVAEFYGVRFRRGVQVLRGEGSRPELEAQLCTDAKNTRVLDLGRLTFGK